MKIKKLCSDIAALSAFYGYSVSAFAQEYEAESTFNFIPILVLVAILVVLRKKLIEEATPHPHGGEEEQHAAVAEKVVKPAAAAAPKPAQAKTSAPAKAEAKPAQAKAAEQEALIDMSKNVSQCQGATAKGSRCSRTTNLETIEVTVEGKKYRFKTCKQHNSDAFKPFLS